MRAPIPLASAPFEVPPWMTDIVGQCTGAGTLVAVVDSGWDRQAKDPRVEPGIALVGGDAGLSLERSSDYQDRIGHGTACTDLLLQVAPSATVLPIRVFGARLETSLRILREALRIAREAGARVVNLSLATTRADFAAPLRAACEEAAATGMIVVAAKHNFAPVSYPADFDCVIGAETTSLDRELSLVVRLGEPIECEIRRRPPLVRTLTAGHVRMDSNSLAAPSISGIVARIMERHPTTDVSAARAWLARMSALCSSYNENSG